jgi:hypothetical protein
MEPEKDSQTTEKSPEKIVAELLEQESARRRAKEAKMLKVKNILKIGAIIIPIILSFWGRYQIDKTIKELEQMVKMLEQ